MTKLSGDEQQRVAVARALSKDVPLILGDEPTGAIDTATSKEVIALFKKLVKDYNKTIILVTHSDAVAQNSYISLRLNAGQLEEVEWD